MFSYIRRKIANAVLMGFQDALETLESSQHNANLEPPALPEPLRLRLAEVEGGSETEDAPKVKRAR